MEKAVTKLDLKGLKCPLPVLKARKAMQPLATGDLVELETTDPLAVIDIPAFCNENGHRLVESAEYDWGHTFLLEKGTSQQA
ncbi:MAG: sulfurtransferase TusA family protein [Pseudomonadota bacterium]